MIVAAIKETNKYEERVSITPDTCKVYTKSGLEVYIEKGAGLGANFQDSEYLDNGAKILDKNEILDKADILTSVS